MELKKGYFKPLASSKERKTSFSISMSVKVLEKLDKEVVEKGTARSSLIENIIKMYFEQKAYG